MGIRATRKPTTPDRAASSWADVALRLSFILSCAIVGACSSITNDLDVAPFLRVQTHPEPAFTDTDALGPFVTHVTDADRTKFGVRPLFMTEERPFDEDLSGRRERVTSFIAPFGKYHSNPRTTQFRFWPLLWWVKERTGPGGLDVDFLLFPLLFFGWTEPPPHALAAGETNDRYFALFPLIGQVNSFVGYDAFQFLAWPIFQRLRKRVYSDEEIFTSIALLAGWTTGAPRGGSWHLLPLYYLSKWTYPPFRAPKYPPGADPSQPLPYYKKESFLWPFIHRQTLNLDRGPGQETNLFAVWPFFKHEKGYDHEFWTFLWPFFRYNREWPLLRDSAQAKIGRDVDPAEARLDENTNVLVDFLSQAVWRYVRTDEYQRRRLLLFLYADYKSLPDDREDRLDSMAILQPIGFWKRHAQEMGPAGGYRDDSYYVLVPFFQTHERTYVDVDGMPDGRSDRFTRLWPLFSYEWNADGSRNVHMFTLLPLRIEKYVKDFLDAFGVFFNVYRYERAPDELGGYTRHTAVLNLVKAYSDTRESSLSIPLLFTTRTVQEHGVTKFSRRVLLGLFGYEGEDGPGISKRRIRLLGLPIDLD